MGRWVVYTFLGIGCAWGDLAHAERNASPEPAILKDSSQEPIFKFDNEDKSAKGSGSSSFRDGTKHYYAPEPELNYQVREQLIAACEGAKKKGMDVFRECFETKKRATLEQLRRQYDGTGNGKKTLPELAPDRYEKPKPY